MFCGISDFLSSNLSDLLDFKLFKLFKEVFYSFLRLRALYCAKDFGRVFFSIPLLDFWEDALKLAEDFCREPLRFAEDFGHVFLDEKLKSEF
mgnify:FL=1